MNKKTIITLLLCLAALLPAATRAQNVTTPYSMYGYGILADRATSMQRQMGSVGYAMNSGRQINVMNPASYASIDSLTFLFDIGADVSMLWTKEGNKSEHSTGGGLDYITMQFPITHWMGASIGLVPYSSVGYSFGNDIANGTKENQGTGGINQAYIGLAGKIGPVSVGLNVAYSFGTIRNDVYTQPENTGRTLFEHIMQVRDWDINFGAQYTYRHGAWDKAVVGVTYAPRKSLHGDSWITTQEVVADARPDTLAKMRLGGHYYTPTSIGGGISWTHEKHSRWMVEVDYTWQQWSDAPYSALRAPSVNGQPGKVLFDAMDFADRSRLAAGGEWTPKLRGNYLQRITYRLGGYWCDDYLRIKGNCMREYGVTAGFGFPTPEGKTLINLGVAWKRRCTEPRNLVSENYFNITLGVNFNELWFWQRKIR